MHGYDIVPTIIIEIGVFVLQKSPMGYLEVSHDFFIILHCFAVSIKDRDHTCFIDACKAGEPLPHLLNLIVVVA